MQASDSQVSYPCLCPQSPDGSECGGNDVCIGNEGRPVNGPKPKNNGPRGPKFGFQIDTLRDVLRAEGYTDAEINKVVQKLGERVREYEKPNK